MMWLVREAAVNVGDLNRHRVSVFSYSCAFRFQTSRKRKNVHRLQRPSKRRGFVQISLSVQIDRSTKARRVAFQIAAENR